ncbi:PREDICTED: protein RCC2-like [Priapulus caudatus]|uniref:Protein RCC2-like n=1 Tax=Priapulus caudatus TaxID=37621 RepID=A0ABM1E1B1_PRICU|nr:PREDICTED: protein RCC2-like [Priapulus caudatus]
MKQFANFVMGGPKIRGSVLYCGGTNWDLIGRRELPKNAKGAKGRNLWAPHRLSGLEGVQVRTVVSGNAACHSVVITTDGVAMSWGRNDKGQLGHGHANRVDVPQRIEALAEINVVDAACGRNHTLCLTDRGEVYGMGENKMGQLGIGNQQPAVLIPKKIHRKGPPIVKIACGAEFSVIVDLNGNLYTLGSPEYGQLGHNTDGKYFVTSNKLAYYCETVPRQVALFIEKDRDNRIQPVMDVFITDVACGNNHSVALDNKKRVYTWGFGGYGRLGHAEQKDEMVPRMVKFFDGPKRGACRIFAGSAYTMAVSELGALYCWGQTKATGEAIMYPKPVQDLSGWTIRSVGCSNRSIVVAADESVVSWGPSPTYGELGYGDNKPKSSTRPEEVKTLAKHYIYAVACGYGHTLMIARDDSEEEKQKLETLPMFKP